MSKIVKDTPIRKNGKTYGVGDVFPYSDKDKKLLWNLTEIKVDVPKDGPTVTEQSRSTKNVEPTAKKKTVPKQSSPSPSSDGKK
jgi:hypothetical protein